MHNLFLVYFINLYMFRAYLGPSSSGTTVCIQQLILMFFLDDCLLSRLDCSNPTRTTDRIVSTNCCIHTVVLPDDGPRYGRNMWRLTKYTKNKLFIELVSLYTIISSYRSINMTKCCLLFLFSDNGIKSWYFLVIFHIHVYFTNCHALKTPCREKLGPCVCNDSGVAI
jgi:hypothetical protein